MVVAQETITILTSGQELHVIFVKKKDISQQHVHRKAKEEVKQEEEDHMVGIAQASEEETEEIVPSQEVRKIISESSLKRLVTCYVCKEEGHFATACPQKGQGGGGRQQTKPSQFGRSNFNNDNSNNGFEEESNGFSNSGFGGGGGNSNFKAGGKKNSQRIP